MTTPLESPGNDGAGRSTLTTRILVGMGGGLAIGLVLNAVGTDGPVQVFILDGAFHVVAAAFLASLKLLVVPLVFVSLVCGTASLEDIGKLGRVGGKTLGLYLMTTAIALTIAVLAAVVVRPGADFQLTTDAFFEPTTPPSLAETLIDLFPTNPIRAMADGNMLQIIVFSVLFGLAVTLSGDRGKRILALFEDFNAVILRLVMLLMNLAPYGVFCLIARVFAVQGFDAFGNLLMYFGLVLVVLFVHAGVVYPMLLWGLARLSPLAFFRSMRDPVAVAFSTASSNATLPVTMENAEERLGADISITSFTVPLGATINMDGTAIMQGVATGFIAQAYGIDIGLSGYVTVVITATLASIGTAGVPGVGLVMLAMVLRQVNLPVEGIGIIIGVDRLLDMVRTAVNVTGDSAVTCIVAKSEGKLSEEVFARTLPSRGV